MKKKSRKKLIVFIVIVALLVILIVRCSNSAAQMVYSEVTAETRDITNYLEFTGDIEAVNVEKVYSLVSAQVRELNVEEGDEVKSGDVIAVLDSSDIEYNIELSEKNLELSKLQNSYNIKDAQTSVDTATQNIANETNSSINQAQKTLLNAQESYQNAADAYNEAYADYLNDETSTIVSAKKSLETAKNSLNTTEYSATHRSNGAEMEVDSSYLDNQLASARLQVKQAEQSLADARVEAKNQVDDLYESFIQAQEALADAEKDYETTLASVDTSTQSAKDALEKTIALTSTETSQMEIDHLKESLEDYVLYATQDGFITELNINEGDFTNSALEVAEITNMDKMQVKVNIDEYDISKVAVGDSVEIYVNATDTYYEGKVASISKKATKQGSVAYVEAIVEFDTDGNISSGFSAEVKLTKSEALGVVTLPLEVISYDTDNSAYVQIKDADGNPVKTPVTLGIADNTYVEVIEGVDAGDVVLYTPTVDYYQMLMSESPMMEQ